jgi:hypothetical protein
MVLKVGIMNCKKNLEGRSCGIIQGTCPGIRFKGLDKIMEDINHSGWCSSSDSHQTLCQVQGRSIATSAKCRLFYVLQYVLEATQKEGFQIPTTVSMNIFLHHFMKISVL